MLFAAYLKAFLTWQYGSDTIIYQNIADVPKVEFDFIIAGGGTAGAVLANRLTERPEWNVLLIEAGPSHQGLLESQVPFMHSQLMTSPYDWNYTTVPQVGLNGRTVDYARGRILGGSSSINFMFYTRGTAGDYNRWAAATDDEGWSWKNLEKYFRKHERWVAPADHHNISRQYDPAVHAKDGMTTVSLPGYAQRATDGRSLLASSELGNEFQYNKDMNSGRPLGFTWNQMTIGNGRRDSAATSYLAEKYLSRKNLFVVVNSRVTRVLPTSKNNPDEFKTVEVVSALDGRTADSKRLVFKAKKEVVLSAGAIGSPQILLSSGIGDISDLRAVGVEPLVHHPSVGKNLTDHYLSYVTYAANSNDTFDAILNDPQAQAAALKQWKEHRTGPFLTVGAGMNQIAWLRLPENSPLWQRYRDPAADKESPHVELIVTNSASFSARSGPHVSIVMVGLNPMSTGSVRLRSSDLFAAPLVDPGYCTNRFDLYVMLAGVRYAQRFLSAPAWNGYVGELVAPFSKATIDDDEAVMKGLRDVVGTAWHPVGTLKMSKKSDSWGVVDPDLKMKGVIGLRVVDASIMPHIPAAHTQAPVYVIAERASDIIKAEWE